MSLRSLTTRLLFRVTGRRVTETESLEVCGVQDVVYWYDSDGGFAGKTTFVNTIALNRAEIPSQEEMEYIFLHEAGHQSVPLPLRLAFWGILLFLGPGFLFGLPAIPILGITTFIATGSVTFATAKMLGAAIAVGVFGLILIPLVRADEFWAEYFAASKLGLDKFEQIHQDRENRASDRAWYWSIYDWFVYPDYQTVLRVARWRKGENPD